MTPKARLILIAPDFQLPRNSPSDSGRFRKHSRLDKKAREAPFQPPFFG
jgi:hypothetical protein